MRFYVPLDISYEENLELLRQLVEPLDPLQPLPPPVPEDPPIELEPDDPSILSGEISGILIAGDYTATSDLIVPYGKSLVIESGTEIYFAGPFGFTIHGDVKAIGSADDNILFHGSEGWEGLLIDYRERMIGSFVSTWPPVDFKYVTIRGGKKFSSDPNFRWWKRGGAIHVISKHEFPACSFIRCSFLDCRSKECGGALELLGDRSLVSECTFMDCSADDRERGGSAIRLTHSRAVITQCYFSRCETPGPGVITEFDSPLAKVEHCTFRNNSPNVTVLQNSGTIQEGNSFS